MVPVSPLATPSSMIAALTVGRYSEASVLIIWSSATAASGQRYGRTYRRSSARSIWLLSHTDLSVFARPDARFRGRNGWSACLSGSPWVAAATVCAVIPSNLKRVVAAAAVMIPVLAACSSGSDSASPDGSSGPSQAQGIKHGPFFPQCGGITDQTMAEQTRVSGLVNTAKNSVGCQWLAGGGILGPHFSFTWYRGSPIGRERKTEELSRSSVEDINIEGHDGFIALGEDPTLGANLCEIGIQYNDDFIEWSISFSEKPFPDSCEVAKELTRQTIVNAK
jgi:hypothetical protein